MISFKLKKIQELRKSGGTCHAPSRYQLLINAENDKLLIIDDPINYIEAISDIDSEK
jgi:hypothetical protein